MSKSLREALRPINSITLSATGSLKIPPGFEFQQRVSEFTQVWKEAMPTFQENPDNAQCVETFFDNLEKICTAFPDVEQFGDARKYRYLLTTLMLYVPWEFLPVVVRQERINKILRNKGLREQLWQQHREDFDRRLDEYSRAGLGMGTSFAMGLMGFEDIQKALMALPLKQSAVFFRDLPGLIFQMPELLAELSEEKKKLFLRHQLNQIPEKLLALIELIEKQYWSKSKFLEDELALAILEPLVKDLEQPMSVRSRANFAVATIFVERRELASAQPYLERIRQIGWGLSEEKKEETDDFLRLCQQAGSLSQAADTLPADSQQLIRLLTDLNNNLKKYLGQRQLNGVFFRLGFFNTELSQKKNKMVEGLRESIDTNIKNLRTGKLSDDSAQELSAKLTEAQSLNKKFHAETARRIDGAGQLGDILISATHSLKEFLPAPTSEPQGSPRGMNLSAD